MNYLWGNFIKLELTFYPHHTRHTHIIMQYIIRVYIYIYIYRERERERHTHSTRIKKKEAKVYTVVFISLYLQYINEKYISTLT